MRLLFLGRILGSTLRIFFARNGPFLAAGLAFHLLLYCLPLLLLITAALGYTLVDSEQALRSVQSVVTKLLPQSQRALTDALTSVVEHRELLGVTRVFSFLLFGSFLFGAARHALNTVMDVDPRPFWKGFTTDLLVMMVAGGLLALVVAVSSALVVARNMSESSPASPSVLSPGWGLVSEALGFVFTVGLFYLIYSFAPARKQGARASLIAAVAGSLLLQISKWSFAAYVSQATGQMVLYGALGGLIFFALWSYYASASFILGALVGWGWEREARARGAAG